MKRMKVTPILMITTGIALLSGSLYMFNNNNDSNKEVAYVYTSPELAIKDSAESKKTDVVIDDEINKLNQELLALEDEIEVEQEEAITTYYHDKFNGKKTASGEVFSNKKLTAAHKTLPFGTKIRVTNLNNNESVIVEINDRGPFSKGKHLDLSKAAFMEIAHRKTHGNLKVKIEIIPDDYEATRSEIVENLESLVQVTSNKNKDLSEFSL